MLVRVYNDNVFPYKEKFKGVWIDIPAKGFVEMDLNEASLFLGTMNQIQVDGGGTPKPECFKMLRIQRDWPRVAQEETERKFICHACNKDLQTKSAYDAHVESMHLDQMSEDDKEVVVKKRGRPAKGVKDDTGANRNGGEAKV